jgi:hypothetical protein
MSEVPVNRIAASGLITLKPEEWAPVSATQSFDLRDYLFMGLILKEKDFREQLKAFDWATIQGKTLCVYCSTDAIIPDWAYMLITSLATPYARDIFFGTPEQWVNSEILHHIGQMDVAPYSGQRVVIKGCTDKVKLSPGIYMALTHKLTPVVASLMFGEPCSTVPVYKRKRAE